MAKKNAEYVHCAEWEVLPDTVEPVVVVVKWWEPDFGVATFFYHSGPEAREAIASPEWNQQFMSELDDEFEVHEDVEVTIRPAVA